MSAKQTQKTAAPSTPAAVPAGSPPVVEKKVVAAQAAAADEGADAEEVTAADIAAALGQISDGPETDETEDDSEGAEAVVDDATGAETEEEDEVAAGESASDDAESGDDAAAGTGDESETETPEAEADPAATEEKTEEVTPTQKRINELVARSKGAEEELSQAKERLAFFEAQTSGRLEPEVLEGIDTLDGLAAQRRKIVELRQKLMRNPQGYETTVAGKAMAYDAEDVADLLAQTDSLILDAIPARERWLTDNARQTSEAAKAYPWMAETRQGQGAELQEMLQKNPALRRTGPGYKLVAADALMGKTLREAGVQLTPELVKRLKAEVTKATEPTKKVVPVLKPVVRKQPPAAPARPGSMPARMSQKPGFNAFADKRLRQGDGGVNDLTASIAARL